MAEYERTLKEWSSVDGCWPVKTPGCHIFYPSVFNKAHAVLCVPIHWDMGHIIWQEIGRRRMNGRV